MTTTAPALLPVILKSSVLIFIQPFKRKSLKKDNFHKPFLRLTCPTFIDRGSTPCIIKTKLIVINNRRKI